jgi:hypothetical protein
MPTHQTPSTIGFQFGSASVTKEFNPKSVSFQVSQPSSASKSIFSPPVSSSSMAAPVNTGGFQSPNSGFEFGSHIATTPITSPFNNNIDNNLSLEQAASNLGLRRRVPLSVQTGTLHPTTRSTPKSLPPKQTRLGLRNVNYTSSDALMKSDTINRPRTAESPNEKGPNAIIPKTSLFLSLPSSTTSSTPLSRKKMIQYNTWVIVYGITPKNLSMVLSKFSSLGTVLSKYPSLSEINNGTNWIAVEYKSYLEAEKALCQNNSILDLGNGQVVVLGVVPVNEPLALSLKLKNFMEFGSTGVERLAVGDGTYDMDNNVDGKNKLNVEGTKVWNEEDVLYKGDEKRNAGKDVRDEDENASVPKNEICDKFMKWVFSW